MHMKRTVQVVGILLFLMVSVLTCLSEAGATAEQGYRQVLRKKGITKIVLDNGLAVVLAENRAAPVVAFQMWVKVGSRNERDGQAGISHVFEHMLFKGTEKRGVGEIAQAVESAGGNINAFTSFDQTVYHLALASRYFDVGLDVIADAIQNSSFDPQELAREAEVVLEELKRSEDNPNRMVTRKLFERAYTVHPYRRPVIGYGETFKKLSREDILDYFQTWYVPNNMSLVIAGDFHTEDVIPKILDAFKGFSSRPMSAQAIPEEPQQEEVRPEVYRQESNLTLLNMAYHIPGIRDARNPAFDLLGMILGEGETSRLYREVKREKELVHSVNAFAYTPHDPGVLLITARLDSVHVEETIGEILRQIQRIRSEPVSAEELNRAKINVESGLIRSKETMQGQARRLGYNETLFGDPFYDEIYLRGIASVTADQITDIAKTYLRPENLTISLLLPPAQRTEINDGTLKSVAAKASRRAEREFKSSDNKKTHGPEMVVLPNGIRLIIKENHAVPTVSVKVAFLGGQRYETDETSGIYNFITAMLDRGTAKRTAEEIAAEIEDMAGGLSGFSGRNSFGADLEILSRHFSRGLSLLADVVLAPSFDPVELEKVRKDILAAIKQEDDVLSRRAGNLFRRMLFKVHPYRLRLLGEPETVEHFTSEDLMNTYTASVSPEGMVIAVVGDVSAKTAREKVEAMFGMMEQRSAVSPVIPREIPSQLPREGVENVERQQAHMILGFPGTTVSSRERYPLSVLSNILAGQGGRLFTELRDKKSLAYAVTAFSQEGLDPGYVATYIACSPEKLEEAKSGILHELQRIRSERVPEEEMERAKRNLVGTFEIQLQTNSAMASAMVFDELYGNGYDNYQKYAKMIEKVGPKDVQKIARKYLDLSRYVLAVVEPQ
jgi:zinc protease